MPSPSIAKWDARYQQAERPNQPAQVLTDNLHLLPPQGQALELACGLGGNALLLAQRGLSVEAWDQSAIALDKLDQFARREQLALNTRQADLTQTPPPAAGYDVICVSAFLERSLCPQISQALKPGGLLFYQTFTRVKAVAGGPSNPDFLLAPGELLSLFGDLEPIAYREEQDCGELHQGLRNQAYLVARRPRV